MLKELFVTNHKGIARFLAISFFILTSVLAKAQSEIEMADDFRGEGKIYVVVGVIILILAGVFIQLFRLERKVKKLEQENQD
jgi:hypothetical protein